jgi:branched-chain amino acid transport system substrate-binding protein
MKQADSTDPKNYLPALQNNSFDGIIGKIAFQKNGDFAVANATLFQEQGGKWQVFETADGGSAAVAK